MSYGDIAEYLGEGGPRQVGRVMSQWGGGVAWWRGIHADGSFLAGHEREALAHYLEEETPLRRTRDGAVTGVNMRQAPWPDHPDHRPRGSTPMILKDHDRRQCRSQEGANPRGMSEASAGMPYDMNRQLPAYHLVRPPAAPDEAPVLDEAQQAVVDHAGQPLLVLAGP